MDNYEPPSQWCKRMQDEAKTGEEAMAYYELAQMWMEERVREMVNTCIYFYGHEFICDGDNREVCSTYEGDE